MIARGAAQGHQHLHHFRPLQLGADASEAGEEPQLKLGYPGALGVRIGFYEGCYEGYYKV